MPMNRLFVPFWKSKIQLSNSFTIQICCSLCHHLLCSVSVFYFSGSYRKTWPSGKSLPPPSFCISLLFSSFLDTCNWYYRLTVHVINREKVLGGGFLNWVVKRATFWKLGFLSDSDFQNMMFCHCVSWGSFTSFQRNDFPKNLCCSRYFLPCPTSGFASRI